MKYFLAGHLWLLVAGVMLVGMTATHWQHHSQFFGMGPFLSDTFYVFVVGAVAAFGLLHLFIAWKQDGSYEELWKRRRNCDVPSQKDIDD